MMSDLWKKVKMLLSKATPVDLLGILGALTTIIFTLISLISSLPEVMYKTDDIKVRVEEVHKRLSELGEMLVALRENDLRVETFLRDYNNSSRKDINLRVLQAQLAALQESTDSLNLRFSKIEKTINQDPVKSLELVLMKKDLESNKLSVDSEMTHIKSEIDKTNNLIFASLFAIAVGVFSQILSNVGKRPEKKNGQQE